MVKSQVRGRTLELPPEMLSARAVAGFRRYLTSTGEMTPEDASRFTLAILGSLLLSVSEWTAMTTARHIQAVLSLRTDLRLRYVEVLRLMRAGHTGELPQHLQPEAFRQLFGALAEHTDELAAPRESAMRHLAEVPLDDVARLEEALAGPDGPHAPPDVPHGLDARDTLAPDPRTPTWQGSPGGTADRSWSNDLARIARRLGDESPAARRGRPAAESRALAEQLADHLAARFLRPAGIEVARVERQQVHGPYLAAETALGELDPVRDLGYEIAFVVPDAISGRGEVKIKPDAWRFSADGNSFELVEYKSHETVPSTGFFAKGGGQDLVSTLRLRGRAAERIPGCRGWVYETALPEMNDVIGWAIEQLQGRGGGEPPPNISAELAQAVRQAISVEPHPITWASKLRVR